MKPIRLFFLLPLFTHACKAQLRPGFDKEECRTMLQLGARTATADSGYLKNIPAPNGYDRIYRSPVAGLDNRWDLWINRSTRTAVVSVRGTTEKAESWLNNFYSAMIPAKGSLHLDENHRFDYAVAENPRAAVHVGWMVSLGFLSGDVLAKLDSCYKAGIRDFILTGHSQGGAITFLLTAWLRHLQRSGKLPADIRFKTYCSAAPKPGNLYFAYEYEAMTQAGWAYNVVNAADWVPETPVSVQTADDLNRTNPFTNAGAVIRKQAFPKNLVLRYLYNRLSKPSRRAQRNYEKYLGRLAGKQVRKYLPGYRQPSYFSSNHYVRCGNTIVLLAGDEYYRQFPDSGERLFVHHFHQPYLWLLEKLTLETPAEKQRN